MLIGLTGKRHVGKTETANILKPLGWRSVHPFGGGKAMVEAYFVRLGIPADTAHRMVHGDLKDTPHPLLPGDGLSRTFMERLGAWLPKAMGPEWTIGIELRLARIADPAAKLLVESVVYEAREIREAGGRIIRIVRPNHEGVVGEQTDAAQAEITADVEIVNDGSLDDLREKVLGILG